MKKYLPLILLLVGALVLVGAFVAVKARSSKEEVTDEDANLMDVPLAKRPVVSLTPTSDGHYLTLKVGKIIIPSEFVDYDLLYKNAEGVTQGVPGIIELGGKKEFEEKLLLGSESSGKFRYDEGVEEGSITLKFRDGNKKLVAKLTSDFKMLTSKELNSPDGKFVYKLDKTPKEGFIVIMNTLGVPGDTLKSISQGPYGVFGSEGDDYPGVVQFESGGSYLQYVDGEWKKLQDGASDSLGIFIQVSSE